MNIKETIRKVLREEEKKKDLSVPIKKLVDLYMENHKDKKYVCGYEFGMGKFAVKNSGERYQRFKITILFNSGYGSKRWPMTMAINTQEEEIMNELQDLILDTFGVIVDMHSTQTPNCESEDIKKGEQTEGELTEKCWKGYTQKGMKTMFGKRYPNCVKKKLTESTISPWVKRRFDIEELTDLVSDVESLIDSGYDKIDAIYDTVRQLIATKQFNHINDDGTEREYWDSYLRYEEPLIKYVKGKLGI